MSRWWEVMFEPGQVVTARLPLPHDGASDFRTVLKQVLLDPVLPMLTLALMAVLTAAILVLVVMAVGNMERNLQSSSLSGDPWSAMASGSSPAANPQSYADYAAAMAEMQAQESQADGPGDAAYVVREQPSR
jgi:hypothetical protein